MHHSTSKFFSKLWSRILYPSITVKLTVVMTVLIACACAGTLYFIDLEVKRTFRKFFEEQFDDHWKLFLSRQESRFAVANDIIRSAVDSCMPLLEENFSDQAAYKKALAEKLYTVMERYKINPDGDQRAEPFLAFVDLDHRLVEPELEHGQYVMALDEGILANKLEPITNVFSNKKREGYMILSTSMGNVLYEIMVAPFESKQGAAFAGEIVFGMPLSNLDQLMDFDKHHVNSGLLLWNEGHSGEVPEQLIDVLRKSVGQDQLMAYGEVVNENEDHLMRFSKVSTSEGFPVAYRMSLFSLADMQQLRRHIGWAVWTVVPLVPLMGAILSIVLSRHMSRPIRSMVKATEAIRHGHFDVRVGNTHRPDEIGLLSRSFNRMAADLALKDRYRHVLDQVTDKEVAQCLLEGSLELGGRMEQVTVLFADIRGFTVLSQQMKAPELVALLNEHMTAMTEVVYRYHGVIDKFMGDAIMVLFGTPRVYGQDSKLALQCATEMIDARNRINNTSAQRIQIGIGLATGQVIAGCMGSRDRLNYTVIGERVNLVSRITSAAGPEEVLMDEATYLELKNAIQVERLEERSLKGFEGQMIPLYKFKSWLS
ncbi:MAG: hypothetical protein B7X06_00100 [Verrucomicrobia bacterium 21-51-4]|nr:MAG: hypothetical protein B7X06_00100 [Verrucomicrobia bacterium 21-51-4]HQU08374.1 adenylate/guanylate cyclase domain-containing protein [Opitutales bacterium]